MTDLYPRLSFPSFALLFSLVLVLCAWGRVAGGASVAVLGGGVSGLTAAHELGERGFEVQVYERQRVLGGKARSYPVNGTGVDGRMDLPGEHGFRIFWNYYRNIFDTLQRIQYNESLSVYEYMREIANNELLTEHGINIYMDFGPQSFTALLNEIRNLTVDAHYLSTEEMDFSLERVEILMTTCDDRMRDEFEGYSFGQFIGAQYRSANFSKFWLNLLHLGGINPYQADLGATTNFVQSLNSPWDDNIAIRVLQKPTNEAWINPWVLQQARLYGNQFYVHKEVQSFTCADNEITSVNIVDTVTGETSVVKADYYVFAVPVDKMISVLSNSDLSQCTDLASLHGLTQLQLSWMSGMQYYLHEDVPITDGFALYLDSPWKISSVSFRQWWPDVNWPGMGDGKEGGIISAIISNFTAPGIVYNKPAYECSQDEIQTEVWEQMKAHLNKHKKILQDDNLAYFSLDSSMSFEDGVLQNEEPMFYASPNSWKLSPNATTEFSNMFLCGDYVRALSRVTPSGMEAANESARRAVNGILAAANSSEKPVKIFTPPRNPDFAALRALDLVRYKLGLPHTGCDAAGCVATS